MLQGQTGSHGIREATSPSPPPPIPLHKHHHLLLHNEEQCAAVAQAFWVVVWGQHIRIVSQGSRQEGHRRSEGAENPDDVGVWGKLLGTGSGSSVQVNGTADAANIRDKSWADELRPSPQAPISTAGLPCSSYCAVWGNPNRGDFSHSMAPLIHTLAHLSTSHGRAQWLRDPGGCHSPWAVLLIPSELRAEWEMRTKDRNALCKAVNAHSALQSCSAAQAPSNADAPLVV